MNPAPTPEQIEANDQAREAIYREQEKMTAREFGKLEDPLRDAVQKAMDDPVRAFEKAIDERDERIEELEVEVDSQATTIEYLREQISDLEATLEEIKAGKAYG